MCPGCAAAAPVLAVGTACPCWAAEGTAAAIMACDGAAAPALKRMPKWAASAADMCACSSITASSNCAGVVCARSSAARSPAVPTSTLRKPPRSLVAGTAGVSRGNAPPAPLLPPPRRLPRRKTRCCTGGPSPCLPSGWLVTCPYPILLTPELGGRHQTGDPPSRRQPSGHGPCHVGGSAHGGVNYSHRALKGRIALCGARPALQRWLNHHQLRMLIIYF